ncbi:MAG TPA: SH3 domain-containing protein [Woeseiaceae bacterium]
MKRTLRCLLAAALLALGALPAAGGEPRSALAAIGVEDIHLRPAFWVARLAAPDQVLMDSAAIAAQNAELFARDSSMNDLSRLPATLSRRAVAARIEDLSAPPSGTLYDAGGTPVERATLDALVQNRNLDAIPARQATRFGLVVRRAALRTFPTDLRVFRSPEDHDIDRFQESALFPGTPVVIAHASRDGRWLFVIAPRYAAWVEKDRVAEGERDTVLAYGRKSPYRIVTGGNVETVFTPERPAVSRLALDMGVRIPVLEDWPADEPVNGQHPYTAHVIELPVRETDGRLALAPALLPKVADSAGDYLPVTRANVVRQAFRFLGERYGWGHSYGARDCSGFVSEVYRSMGVMLPRNTSDQGVSPAFDKRLFDAADSRAERLVALRSLDVGHLVYIPGHVMMVVGTVDGEPWVIHDTTGFGHVAPDGTFTRVRLNGVSITPLIALAANETELYIDRMTSIVRVVPAPAKEAPPPL